MGMGVWEGAVRGEDVVSKVESSDGDGGGEPAKV